MRNNPPQCLRSKLKLMVLLKDLKTLHSSVKRVLLDQRGEELKYRGDVVDVDVVEQASEWVRACLHFEKNKKKKHDTTISGGFLTKDRCQWGEVFSPSELGGKLVSFCGTRAPSELLLPAYWLAVAGETGAVLGSSRLTYFPLAAATRLMCRSDRQTPQDAAARRNRICSSTGSVFFLPLWP